MTRNLLICCLAFILPVAAPALPALAQTPAGDLQRFEYTKLVMGVEAKIVLYALAEPQAREAAATGFRRMEAYDRALSNYKRDSEANMLAAIGADGPTIVSEDLHQALSQALVMAEISGGAFDPTVGPLTRLWRQARQEGRLPDEGALAEARAHIGFEHITLESPRTVRLARRGMELDFGAIGKGLAAHEAVAAIAAAGAPVCLVDLGGDVSAGAAPPGTDGWTVELRPGRGKDVRLALKGWTAATSGDTEQFIEIDGQRYSHILDPRTGLGLTTQVSVVVLARDGAIADALSSAVSVLGPERGVALVERLPEAEALVRQTGPDGEARETMSSGFPRAEGREILLNAHEHPPAGFESLFNGRDLEGWQGFVADAPVRWAMEGEQLAAQQRAADERMRTHWSVIDGAIHFDGDPEGENLVSARRFGDFELICDWKLAPPPPPGDSGIYLRGTPQVQIWDHPTGSGGLYNNQKHPSKPRVVADRPVGEWNRFVIRMEGERVTVHLNGRLVVDDVPLENYWDRAAPLPARGEIELQAHGSPLWFRNVFIRDLDNPEGQ